MSLSAGLHGGDLTVSIERSAGTNSSASVSVVDFLARRSGRAICKEQTVQIISLSQILHHHRRQRRGRNLNSATDFVGKSRRFPPCPSPATRSSSQSFVACPDPSRDCLTLDDGRRLTGHSNRSHWRHTTRTRTRAFGGGGGGGTSSCYTASFDVSIEGVGRSIEPVQ